MTSTKQLGSASPIVVADETGAIQLLQRHIPAHHRLAPAATLDEARDRITAGTPLVLCGVHFDDGRMYDLLRYMRATPALQRIPFLALRLHEGQLDDAIYESVTIAVDALGGDGFVDMHRWQLRYGDEAAGQRLAHRVEALIHGEDPPDSAFVTGPGQP